MLMHKAYVTVPWARWAYWPGPLGLRANVSRMAKGHRQCALLCLGHMAWAICLGPLGQSGLKAAGPNGPGVFGERINNAGPWPTDIGQSGIMAIGHKPGHLGLRAKGLIT